MPDQVRLSYTAAKRYEGCPFRQYAHKTKQTRNEVDERKFFVGRVVHEAAEVFARRRGLGCHITDFVPAMWAKEEADGTAKGTLPWLTGERDTAWAKAIEVADTLEEMLRTCGILQHPQLYLEPRTFVYLGDGFGMYANPDLLVVIGTTGFIGETKTGSSYDPDQPAWYAEAFSRVPEFAHITEWVAVPLRPAVTDKVAPVVVGITKRKEQAARATKIALAMQAGEWEPTPSYQCNFCEARHICPSYQSTYGHLNKRGQVGLG